MAEKETKIKLRFLTERKVLDENKQIVAHYKPGQVREFTENSARHWLSRGVAEEVQGAAKQTRRGNKKPAGAEAKAKAEAEAKAAGDPEIQPDGTRKAPPPADPMTHGDHPAAAAAAGKA